jgi:membrane protein YqaA with SNARE-associated domain
MTRGAAVDTAVARSPAARRQQLFRLAVAVFFLGYLVVVGALWLSGGFDARIVGYPGVWLFSLIGSSSIILPVPGLAAVCAGAIPSVGLNPAVLGVVAGSAEAIGEMTGYLAGVAGGSFVEKSRHFPRIREWVVRRGGPVFFLMATFPNPFFDVVGIAAGSVRYPVWRFVVITFAGKAVKSTWIAFGCYYGVGAIQRLVS